MSWVWPVFLLLGALWVIPMMGAYHEGYARQELFGGNAQSVVDNAAIPVIMAH